jgi:hypothetical protein
MGRTNKDCASKGNPNADSPCKPELPPSHFGHFGEAIYWSLGQKRYRKVQVRIVSFAMSTGGLLPSNAAVKRLNSGA